MAEPHVATYSIVACDLDQGQWGVATQSKFLAVGSIVPWAEPGVGAIATQSYANPRYGPDGLALLREGVPAGEVVRRLTDADDGRDQRQVGVVDRHGHGATFTGTRCMDWAGGIAGECFAAQGNILVGAETVDALAATFSATAGRPLAERLLECIAAAQERGRRSAGTAVRCAARRRARRGVRRALRHRRRPARRRPCDTDRGDRASLRAALPVVREVTVVELVAGRRRAPP